MPPGGSIAGLRTGVDILGCLPQESRCRDFVGRVYMMPRSSHGKWTAASRVSGKSMVSAGKLA